MKKSFLILAGITGIVIACNQQQPQETEEITTETSPKEMYELNGFSSKEAWGDHLVAITGCDDCHSPKKMTDKGPVPDPSLRLSGFHQENGEADKLDRLIIEKNGYGACNEHLTSWTGPWGVSFAANLTSDETGIGSWSEEQFFRAIRKGKYKGMEDSRDLLPPMPWFNYARMTDAELSAMFAYLKTLPAIENVVAEPKPPLAAMQAYK